MNKQIKLITFLSFSLLFISQSEEIFASYKDKELMEVSNFEAASLDMLIAQEENDAEETISDSDKKIKRDFSVKNDGLLNFQYMAEFEKVSGDNELCNNLDINVKIKNENKFSGKLSSFQYFAGTLPTTEEFNTDDWKIEVSLPSNFDKDTENTDCDFNIKLTAWQLDFTTPENGWIDIERIEDNKIHIEADNSSDNSFKPGDIVINEFMPNPTGSDSADMPNGEWIELYNNTKNALDIAGWYFEDESGKKIIISNENSDNNKDTTDSGETDIHSEDFLVIYLNSAILNNDKDHIYLYNTNNESMDDFSYQGAKEGKSFARIPDGIGPWIDPDETKNGHNKLSQEEIDSFQKQTLDLCFNKDGELQSNSNNPLCNPLFLVYISMLKNNDSKKLNNSELFIKEPISATTEATIITTSPIPETTQPEITLDNSTQPEQVQTQETEELINEPEDSVVPPTNSLNSSSGEVENNSPLKENKTTTETTSTEEHTEELKKDKAETQTDTESQKVEDKSETLVEQTTLPTDTNEGTSTPEETNQTTESNPDNTSTN